MKTTFERMKQRLLVLSLLIGTLACGQGRVNWPGKGSHSGVAQRLTNVYLVVISGQSNAQSHGQNLSSLFTGDPTKTKYWDSTSHDFQSYSSAVLLAIGLETQTASLQAAAKGVPIVYMIRATQGATAISSWDSPSGALWLYLKTSLQEALVKLRAQAYNPIILSTIWLQGEQDIGLGTPQATYQTKLEALIDNYRALDPTAIGSSKWVNVKIRTDYDTDANGPDANIANINTSFVNVESTRSNVTSINPQSIGATTVDGVHYTTAGYILIANAWNATIP